MIFEFLLDIAAELPCKDSKGVVFQTGTSWVPNVSRVIAHAVLLFTASILLSVCYVRRQRRAKLPFGHWCVIYSTAYFC